MNSTPGSQLNRIAGMALMGGAALAIFFMSHHPSTSSQELGAALGEIRDEGVVSAWVHGMLILVMVGIWFGTYGLTRRLGAERALPVLGFMLFGLGTLAYCLAAMVSGFIVPEIGSRFADVPADQLEQAKGMLLISGISNQAFANAGLIGTSLGIVAWSLALMTHASINRIVGILGLAVGLLPAVLLLSGNLTLHLAGMTGVVITQSTWYLLIGYLMIWGPLKKPRNTST